jgi:hypothetical protein
MPDSDRRVTRSTSQFSLRALLGFVLSVCLLCSVISAADHSLTSGLLAFGVAVRLLAILVVGAIIGFVVGNIPGSVIAGLIGVAFADVVWCGLFAAFRMLDLNSCVMNPLVVMALIACPPAAAKSSARALTVGITLSVVLPIAFAVWFLWTMPRGPTVRGTGMAEFVTVLVSVAAAFTGIVGTVGIRFLIEAIRAIRRSRFGQRDDSTNRKEMQ